MATSDNETALRAAIQFCVQTGMTPTQTLNSLKHTDRYRSKDVSRSLLFKWPGRFREGWMDSLQQGSHSRAHGETSTDGECRILLEGKSFFIDLTDFFHFVSISELIL